jgi:hypothetical protein
MATDSDDTDDAAISCSHCEKTFEKREERDEHLREAHDVDPEEGGGTAEEAAAADTEAAGSTGSITEETNDSPSAAEPGEAAGPSVSDDTDPDLDHDDS